MDCLRTNLGRQQSSALGGEGHELHVPSPLRPAAWLLPYGKRRERSLRSGTAREVSSDRSAATAFLYVHPNLITSMGRKMHPETRTPPQKPVARAALLPRGPAPRARPAWGDATVVPQPGAPAPVPLPTCQTPGSPRCRGWVINQCHMFPLSSHWKKCTSPRAAREVGRAGGWGEIPESFGLQPYPQWISHPKRWFSRLLSPQRI